MREVRVSASGYRNVYGLLTYASVFFSVCIHCSLAFVVSSQPVEYVKSHFDGAEMKETDI